jgi:hypothetical protein
MPLEYLAFCKYTGLLTGSKNGLFISKTDICKFCCCEYLQHLFMSGVTFLWPRLQAKHYVNYQPVFVSCHLNFCMLEHFSFLRQPLKFHFSIIPVVHWFHRTPIFILYQIFAKENRLNAVKLRSF